MISVGIVGASGYAGGELLRILLFHSRVKILQATSQRFVGEPVTLHHPNLRGLTDLCYSDIKNLAHCDVLFVSLPNGVSMDYMKYFRKIADRIIDLGADFRLKSSNIWKEWYKKEHVEPDFLKDFVYGVPEIRRSEMTKARYIAGPGCEAIVSILSLWPLVKNGLIGKEVIIDAKMSSSQAGNRGTDASHHPERAGVVRSYMPTGHRHIAEIEQELTRDGKNPSVSVSATALDIVRGLLVTIHTTLKKKIVDKDVWSIYKKEYGNEPFIRIVKQKTGLYRYPEPKILQGTNYCDIGFEIDLRSQRLVVIGAIDNLVKGTSGNAIQCMNIMYGFDEITGLTFPGLHPI